MAPWKGHSKDANLFSLREMVVPPQHCALYRRDTDAGHWQPRRNWVVRESWPTNLLARAGVTKLRFGLVRIHQMGGGGPMSREQYCNGYQRRETCPPGLDDMLLSFTVFAIYTV